MKICGACGQALPQRPEKQAPPITPEMQLALHAAATRRCEEAIAHVSRPRARSQIARPVARMI